MPVRNGRWVPWAVVIEQEAAAKIEAVAEEVVAEVQARKPRRSRKAAEAAIAAATGVQVSLDATPEPVEPVEPEAETDEE